MNMESVHSDNHIFDLRRLYDKIETNVRSLEALGLGVDAYGALLTPIVVKRLPPELRLNLARKVPTDDWRLDNIMRVFLEELEAKERASLPKQPRNTHSQLPHRPSRDFPTTRTCLGGRESGCCYCKQDDHAPAEYKRVNTHEARKAIIRESGRCFICLRRGHVSRDCRSNFKCSNCRGRHHVSLCNKWRQSKSTDGKERTPSNVPDATSLSSRRDSSLNPSTPSFQPTDNSASCYTNNGTDILLQVAQAFVFNPHEPSRRTQINILFDTGSQGSYVTQQVCNFLGLPKVGTKSISLVTFGSRNERIQHCDVVKLGFETIQNDALVFQMLSISHICEPIANCPVNLEHYPQLKTFY